MLSEHNASYSLEEKEEKRLFSPTFREVEAVIRSRRTVKRFAPEPVPRHLLVSLLDAAVWAPNHKLTEPWRFYLLDGESRTRVGEIAATISRAKAKPQADTADIEHGAAQVLKTWAEVPTLLYVTMISDANPEIDEENYGAVCCAIQNFMLLAHAAGLVTSWNSGTVAQSPALRDFVGAHETERMVGLIRVGYPDPQAPELKSSRTPAATFTTWVDGVPAA
jgi:nitroreductase